MALLVHLSWLLGPVILSLSKNPATARNDPEFIDPKVWTSEQEVILRCTFQDAIHHGRYTTLHWYPCDPDNDEVRLPTNRCLSWPRSHRERLFTCYFEPGDAKIRGEHLSSHGQHRLESRSDQQIIVDKPLSKPLDYSNKFSQLSLSLLQ